MEDIIDELELEIAEMRRLRMIPDGKARKVVAYLSTDEGRSDAREYRENGMKISEIADHLIMLVG